MLKVTTANVNGIRAAHRRGGLHWLAAVEADVLCLQEVRASGEQVADVLGQTALSTLQLSHAPSQAAGRAGVAILSRDEPLAVRIDLPGFADQGRWIEADVAVDGGLLTVVSAYVHTGEAATERQREKFAFLDAMNSRMAVLAQRAARGAGEALITGDLNVAHREADLKNWKGNLGKAGFLPEERGYFDRWFSSGWTDLVRSHAGDGPGPYSWWSWRGKAFDLDSGWRIDYLLATSGLASRMLKVETGRAESYAQRWSDHAAVTGWFD